MASDGVSTGSACRIGVPKKPVPGLFQFDSRKTWFSSVSELHVLSGHEISRAIHGAVAPIILKLAKAPTVPEAADKAASPRSMDGSPFSMVAKPVKMKGDENHAFRRPPADQARDGFVSNLG